MRTTQRHVKGSCRASQAEFHGCQCPQPPGEPSCLCCSRVTSSLTLPTLGHAGLLGSSSSGVRRKCMCSCRWAALHREDQPAPMLSDISHPITGTCLANPKHAPTHSKPSEEGAHPHVADGTISIAQVGIAAWCAAGNVKGREGSPLMQ